MIVEPGVIQEYADLYDEMAQRRHDDGRLKYGALKFEKANTLEEALEELVDLGNYARYTFIKICNLRDQIAEAEKTYAAEIPLLEEMRKARAAGDLVLPQADETPEGFINPFRR